MATFTTVTLTDSLNDKVTEGVETYTFFNPLTGEKLEIELGSENHKKFLEAASRLNRFINVAEVVVVEVPTPTKAVKNSDTAKIREWAKANGFDIGDRGRIKAEIMTAYTAAQEVIKSEQPDAEVVSDLQLEQPEGEVTVVAKPTDPAQIAEQREGRELRTESTLMIGDLDVMQEIKKLEAGKAAKLDETANQE